MSEERNKLIEDNINLIYFVLQKHGLYNRDAIEKYFDVGMIGLVKAAKKFDFSRGIKASPYLVRAITNEIFCEIRKENSCGRDKLKQAMSLSCKIGDNIFLGDIIKSSENIEDGILHQENIDELYKAIAQLSRREQIILIYSYGLNGQEKLDQISIGKIINCTKTNVSTLKHKAIKKIRKILNDK